MTINQLNEVLADRLGRNPLGKPIYKWVHSESYFHLMKVQKSIGSMVGDAMHSDISKRQSEAQTHATDSDLPDYFSLLDAAVPASGILLVQPDYVERKMVELEDTWLIAHWHDAMSQADWERKYGINLLWPREGYYSPTNLTAAQGKMPTINVTEQIIGAIRRHREKSFEDFYADGERIIERQEKASASKVSDMIDDACTALGNIPGSRAGDVQFQSHTPKVSIEHANNA